MPILRLVAAGGCLYIAWRLYQSETPTRAFTDAQADMKFLQTRIQEYLPSSVADALETIQPATSADSPAEPDSDTPKTDDE